MKKEGKRLFTVKYVDTYWHRRDLMNLASAKKDSFIQMSDDKGQGLRL